MLFIQEAFTYYKLTIQNDCVLDEQIQLSVHLTRFAVDKK